MVHLDVRQREHCESTKAVNGLLMGAHCENGNIVENDFTKKQKLEQKKKGIEEFRSKVFLPRNSLMTDLWKINHIRTIYNICLGLLIYQYLCISSIYYSNYDRMISDLSLLAWLFGKFQIVCYVWFTMMGSISLVLYPMFRYWSHSRRLLNKAGFYDFMFLTSYVAFQAALLFFPGRIVMKYDMPILSSTIIAVEQIRLIMKCHAFVRENAPKVLKYKPHQDGDKTSAVPCPDFGKFFYFLFAPTLIYRDSYPRTPFIRWRQVMVYFADMTGCFLAAYPAILLYIENTFKDFCKEPMSLTKYRENMVSSGLAGVLVMFFMFYAFMHCWLNAWAEVLRFGDRMFYLDWWNSTSHAYYYRTWNTVVSDWLYFYIYRDTCQLLHTSKGIGVFFVLFASGAAHEYILSTSLKFSCPLLLVYITVFSVIWYYVNKGRTSPAWNVLLWIALFQGYSAIVMFYSTEWYARINNPGNTDSWSDYFVPRSNACPYV